MSFANEMPLPFRGRNLKDRYQQKKSPWLPEVTENIYLFTIGANSPFDTFETAYFTQ